MRNKLMFGRRQFTNMMPNELWCAGAVSEKFLASLSVPGGLEEGNCATPEFMHTFQMGYMAVSMKALFLLYCKLHRLQVVNVLIFLPTY